MLLDFFRKKRKKTEEEKKFDEFNETTRDLRKHLRQKTGRLNELLDELSENNGRNITDGNGQ